MVATRNRLSFLESVVGSFQIQEIQASGTTFNRLELLHEYDTAGINTLCTLLQYFCMVLVGIAEMRQTQQSAQN